MANIDQPIDVRTLECVLFAMKRLWVWGFSKAGVRVKKDISALSIGGKEVVKVAVRDFALTFTGNDGEGEQWSELQSFTKAKNALTDKGKRKGPGQGSEIQRCVGKVSPRQTADILSVGTWNVKGISDVKVCRFMSSKNAMHFASKRRDIRIVSGSAGGGKECAGVGYVISPRLGPRDAGFCPSSNRIASSKLMVDGGQISIFAVCSPHNLKPLEERLQFYEAMEELLRVASTSGLAADTWGLQRQKWPA